MDFLGDLVGVDTGGVLGATLSTASGLGVVMPLLWPAPWPCWLRAVWKEPLFYGVSFFA